MLALIPTYKVSWENNGSVTLRVPKTELSAVVAALIFNQIHKFTVEIEKEPHPFLDDDVRDLLSG